MAHSAAFAENEWKNAAPWNAPSRTVLAPGESRTYGLKFLMAPAIREIESTLGAARRLVAVGIPGYALPQDIEGNLFLRYAARAQSFAIEPTAALSFGISFGPVTKEADGSLTQSYRHIEFGGGTWLLDPNTLRAIGKVQKQNTPPELGKIEGKFEGLKVKTVGDPGVSAKPGQRYILRWETLDANRDQPRKGALPEPSMLRLYAVKTEPK